mmetsp:Transcript_21707/g.47262  ORF Transcript_21707/g.47262 Transcript_21707/m.47262 type:complete len:251 (+) Transcript_21707:732-1484(+)
MRLRINLSTASPQMWLQCRTAWWMTSPSWMGTTRDVLDPISMITPVFLSDASSAMVCLHATKTPGHLCKLPKSPLIIAETMQGSPPKSIVKRTGCLLMGCMKTSFSRSSRLDVIKRVESSPVRASLASPAALLQRIFVMVVPTSRMRACLKSRALLKAKPAWMATCVAARESRAFMCEARSTSFCRSSVCFRSASIVAARTRFMRAIMEAACAKSPVLRLISFDGILFSRPKVSVRQRMTGMEARDCMTC